MAENYSIILSLEGDFLPMRLGNSSIRFFFFLSFPEEKKKKVKGDLVVDSSQLALPSHLLFCFLLDRLFLELSIAITSVSFIVI